MDNASPLPRLAAPLATAGSIRLPSPALGLFRMPEGYVLLSRDGAFFSTDLAGTEQVMRFGGAPVHEDFDDGPPRIFEAAGMLFAFWRGDRDQWFTRDGTTWDRLPLPAFHDRRRLDWRGVLETPDGLCIWASYTRDNAEIGFGDDLIYDSYVVGAALFEGPDPERLAFTGTFEDCFDRYTVTGLACAKGRLAALCASEPPRKGSLVCAFRDAGGVFQPASPMDIEDYGVSVRDYKINFAYNRTKLYAFQDRLYARGRSLYRGRKLRAKLRGRGEPLHGCGRGRHGAAIASGLMPRHALIPNGGRRHEGAFEKGRGLDQGTPAGRTGRRGHFFHL